MAVITNQKDLQISFALDDGNGRVTHMTLPIKPEELTRTEPNRVTAQQTLDGAFIDEFGRGLTTITISGNTGWGQGTRPAGDIMFSKLRDDFIHEWSRARRARIDVSQDPNLVRLIFIDALNGPYVADVVPTQFVLRRSKSQPLLFLYNITMTVVTEGAANPYPELLEDIEDEAKVSASVESMDSSVVDLTGPPVAVGAVAGAAGGGGLIGELEGLSANIGSLGQAALDATKSTLAPAMAAAQQVIATANAAKRVLTEAEQATVNIAKELSTTATKMWDAVGAVASLPAAAAGVVMRVKGAFSNLGCLLSNGFTDAIGKAKLPSYPYGSSNCSSTGFGGGSSYEVPETPATTVTPASPIVIIMTPAVTPAITVIADTDLTEDIDENGLITAITDVVDGVFVGSSDDDVVGTGGDVGGGGAVSTPVTTPASGATDYSNMAAVLTAGEYTGGGLSLSIDVFGGVPGGSYTYEIYKIGSVEILQNGGTGYFDSGGNSVLSLQIDQSDLWDEADGLWVFLKGGSNPNSSKTTSVNYFKP